MVGLSVLLFLSFEGVLEGREGGSIAVEYEMFSFFFRRDFWVGGEGRRRRESHTGDLFLLRLVV